MLDKLMEKMGNEGSESPELQVLQEIKNLMDTRLGDKLKGGMSISKVEVEPLEGSQEEESGESPELEKSELEGGSLSPQEEEELNKIRSKMV